jgi:glyoxylase-like metal-dependent hydrolase (beta-lactamase superfamily II)
MRLSPKPGKPPRALDVVESVATDLNLCRQCTDPLPAGHINPQIAVTHLPVAVIEISRPLLDPEPAARCLSENVFCFEDTCKVYLLRTGRQAIAIDFGSGDVLEELSSLGVDRISDVLVTHHHRDQVQGLKRAVEAGVRIWVPANEQDLFNQVDAHWQARAIANNYNNRQDRFSLLNEVPVSGSLDDYSSFVRDGINVQVIPTPGHTVGSITLLAEIDAQRLAFCGDLIAGPGKLWSLAATQWTYNGAEGAWATIASLLDLKDRRPERLLPSHGEVMNHPDQAIDSLVGRLERLLELRREPGNVAELREEPYEQVTPHLLRNRTSHSVSYVLISKTGKAMLIDFGYDFIRGLAAGTDRASRRPWLYTIERLKGKYGISQLEAIIPTHYHDDHVAGCNLLRQVEGTQVWAAENMADVLERPEQYDLPCLWYEPIPVDRRLPTGKPIAWEEYELTLHEQPGHTRYAVAIETTVGGKHVLFIGDQMGHADGLGLNYVYAGGFESGDYVRSAELYQRVRPDLLLTGHWEPIASELSLLEEICRRSEALDALHRDLLPVEDLDLESHGPIAEVHPYRVQATAGRAFELTIEIRNPAPVAQEILLELALPSGWLAEPGKQQVFLTCGARATLGFSVIAPAGTNLVRARIGVDMSVGTRRLGQVVEALVDVQ